MRFCLKNDVLEVYMMEDGFWPMRFCLVDKVVKTSGLDWVELCELECRLSLGLVVPVKTNDLPMLKLANIGGENNV